LSRVASTAVRRIARVWALSDVEMAPLLGIAQGDVARFYAQADSTISPAARERVAVLIGIWENLASLFGGGPIAHEWIRRPNRDFDDHSPLEHMMTGEFDDLVAVRRYLSLLET
jgi:uncharacterized protein (DUF2384 family)